MSPDVTCNTLAVSDSDSDSEYVLFSREPSIHMNTVLLNADDGLKVRVRLTSYISTHPPPLVIRFKTIYKFK